MNDKSTEEMYEEYGALLRKVNRKQGKLIERLREELVVQKDREDRLNQLHENRVVLLERAKAEIKEQRGII